MTRLELFRAYLHPTRGVFGVLTGLGLHQGLQLVTVEKSWRGNQPFISCVPDGLYALVRHNGTKYQDTWVLSGGSVAPVPTPGFQRSTCAFHVGNRERNVTGCIAPGVWFAGATDQDRAVRSSEIAMGLLRDALDGIEGELELQISSPGAGLRFEPPVMPPPL